LKEIRPWSLEIRYVLLNLNLWCDNNQPEVGCKSGQASQGTVPRHPATAGRKPKRKMAPALLFAVF
jgi:hypothetical protein